MKTKVRARLPLQVMFCLVFLFGEPCVESATSRNPWFGIEWERQFGDDKCSYDPVGMAVNPKDKAILIAVETLGERACPEESRIMLWKIGENGQLLRKISVKRPELNEGPPLVQIHALACAVTGDTLLVVEEAITTMLYLEVIS